MKVSPEMEARIDDLLGQAKSKPNPPPARYAKPGADGMTKLERDYSKHLDSLKQAGEIFRWELHAIKLLIVPGVPKTDISEGVASAWYTPDFVVYEMDGTVAFHETKGFLDQASDGWLKFKAAASLYPFPFYMVQKVAKKDGTWKITRYAR